MSFCARVEYFLLLDLNLIIVYSITKLKARGRMSFAKKRVKKMRKHAQKIFATASVIIAIVLIIILIVTAFGGIPQDEFDNSLVKGLFITLGILYVLLASITLMLIFVNDDVVKEVTLRSEQEGSSKVTSGVIRKLVKETCASVDGVKIGKIALVANEYGVRIKINVRVNNKDVVETEVYLRAMLEETFMRVLSFRFHAIEIKFTALTPNVKVTQSDVRDKVDGIMASKGESVEDDEVAASENFESDIVQDENAAIAEQEEQNVPEIDEDTEVLEVEDVAATDEEEFVEDSDEITDKE